MSRRPPRPEGPTRRAALLGGALLGSAAWSGCRAAPAAAAPSAARQDAELAAAERLADLTDERASVAPIDAAERAARRARLGGILARHDADALLLEPGATMTYLAGLRWGRSERLFALVVLADGTHFWIVPAFEAERARRAIDAPGGPGGAIVAWAEDEHPFAPTWSALRERRVRRLAIEPALRFTFVEELARVAPPAARGAPRSEPDGARRLFGDGIVSGRAIVVELRARKDAHELQLLRRANELTQRALARVAEELAPGMTGAEIGALVDAAHRRLGMSAPWNLSLIGPAAALPHGAPDGGRLERGSVLLVDAGAALHDYQSDETRTWVVGAPPAGEVERVWWVVRDAQRAAYEAIRPGVRCQAIDAVARRAIAERGFGTGYAAMTHRLGHGIGLEGHEDPYFDGASEVVLQSGMTLSDEPGIYLPGRFGVRIEDIVAVTEDGADHFGSWQRGPGSPA